MPTARTASPDRPSLARDSGRAVVGSVVSNACNVLVILVIARWLGGEAVGQYTIAFAIRAILLLVCGLGMRTAMTRFVAAYLAKAEPDTVRGSVRAGILVPLALSVLVGAAWFALAEPLARGVFGDPSLEFPLQMFALSLPFFVLTDNALAATQGFQTMRAYVWVGQVLEPVTRFGLTLGVLMLGMGIDSVSVALFCGSVASAAAALLALRRMVSALPGSGSVVPWRELVSFGSMSWVASMATQGLLWADVVILGVLVSSEAVGEYQVAARVVLIGMFVITPLTASMAPRIAHHWARGDRAGVTDRYVAIVRWTSRLSFPLLAGLVAVPAAVLHLFGPGFGDATGVVLILVAGAVAEAVGAPSSVLLNQIGRNRLNMTINISALALNIGLNLVLVPRWGIEGAAVAWAATLVAGAVVRIVVVRRVATSRWPWSREVAVAAVGGVLAALAALGLTRLLPDVAAVQLAAAALVVALVYGAVVVPGGLDSSERGELSRAVTLRLPALRRWRIRWHQRHADTNADELEIDELISPFRVDILARAELFTLARRHAEQRSQDFDGFLALVRQSRYGVWFDEVLVRRGYVGGTSARARERAFGSIVTASLQLMDRHDRSGRESLGRVSVVRLPAGTDLDGWSLAEDRWVLLDGGHRIALAMLAGEKRLAPSDYVVDAVGHPPNNTVAFLASGSLSADETVAFLARGLVAEAERPHVRSWADLLDRLAVPANRASLSRWPGTALLAERDPAARAR